jgi:hypothetical protein
MALSKKQQKEQEKAQQLVDKFNSKYPVGSTVMHRKGTHSSYKWEQREVERAAYVAASLEPVAFFTDLSGYYSITPDFVDYNS